MMDELSIGDMIELCHTATPFVSLSSIVFVKNIPPKDTIFERVEKFEKKLKEVEKFLNNASAQLSNNAFLNSAPKEIVDGRINQLVELEEEYSGYSKLVSTLKFASNYKRLE